MPSGVNYRVYTTRTDGESIVTASAPKSWDEAQQLMAALLKRYEQGGMRVVTNAPFEAAATDPQHGIGVVLWVQPEGALWNN